jgi:hypothetical protein
MNCQEFWDGYPELAHSGETHRHAIECEACARQLAEQAALAAGLRAAAAEWRATEAPDRVERNLVAAFRNQQTIQTRPPQRAMWLPVLTWVSAAAVLVVLAFLTIQGNKPVAPRRPAVRAVELAAAAPAAIDWVSDDDSNSGEFIPLPNAEQVGENDDVNVVRMEVPRSAMLAVGLPVSLGRESELVEADVMLGSDGLARAVRFVNE